MRILDVAEFYSHQGGGVRTYIEQKFAAAKAAGHQLCVVAPGSCDRTDIMAGGKLMWVKAPAIPMDRRYRLFWRPGAINEIVASERPDFIEGSSPWKGGWFAGRQSPAIAKALVIHQDPVLSYPHTLLRGAFNATQIDALFAWFFRYFRRLQDLYDTSVVASPWLAARLSSLGMRAPEIVPFGVDQSAFTGAARSESLRKAMLAECGLSEPDARLLITVGRHHPEKRLPMMIDAFDSASSVRPIGLYIVGDGPSRRSIEKLASKIRGVYVAGFVHERARLATMLASADAYIHACPSETFGMVIAEAMAAGLPLILPAAGGAVDLAPRNCAEFYEPDNADDCAGAIIRLLSRDQSALRAAVLRSAAALSSTADHFSRLFALYESLVDQKTSRQPRRELTPNPQADVGAGAPAFAASRAS